jgi:nuclear transport factor 2 (NTF2) superfamily protein
MILLLTVASINIDYYHGYLEKKYFHEVQDSAELMAQYNGPEDQTVLEEVSMALSENPDPRNGVASARKIVDPFLKKTLGSMKYRFVEMKYLKGKEIASRGKFEDAKDVGVAVKCYGNYIFKLYVWE